jgi:hypothetical protein
VCLRGEFLSDDVPADEEQPQVADDKDQRVIPERLQDVVAVADLADVEAACDPVTAGDRAPRQALPDRLYSSSRANSAVYIGRTCRSLQWSARS